MRNAKVLARHAIEEVAGNRLARGKANAVYKAIKLAPGGTQVGEHFFNLRIVGHVAVEHQFGIKLGSKLGNAVFKAFAHVAKRQLSPLGVAGFGNAIGDGSVGQNASD